MNVITRVLIVVLGRDGGNEEMEEGEGNRDGWSVCVCVWVCV